MEQYHQTSFLIHNLNEGRDMQRAPELENIACIRVAGVGGGGCNAPPGKGCNKGVTRGQNGNVGWGMSLGRRGQSETFMRTDPDGTRHIIHVTWAIGH